MQLYFRLLDTPDRAACAAASVSSDIAIVKDTQNFYKDLITAQTKAK
jgi:hypothetical protein